MLEQVGGRGLQPYSGSDGYGSVLSERAEPG